MRLQLSENFGYVVKRTRLKHYVCAQSFLALKDNKIRKVRLFSSMQSNPRSRIVLLTLSESTYVPKRGIAGAILGHVVRNVFKVRYWIFGGAVGSGVQASRKYEEWKDSLPDMSWMQNLMPRQEQLDDFRSKLVGYKDKITLPDNGWFKSVLDSAQSRAKEFQIWLDQNASDGDITSIVAEGLILHVADGNANSVVGNSASKISASASSFFSTSSTKDANDKFQEELLQVQMRYQREVERLEKENRELRRQLLLKNTGRSSKRKVKKLLIDMYSECLDEISEYDANYKTQDHLPRVVVVGDQSSGKTSVLEMIAQARIFPRGSGEMMTRAPVMVTLSEGPYSFARFKDSSRDFDLTNETDLQDLRREVEIRMKKSISKGQTVSHQVISMSVKGPGLQRMVLVDLPGIISTVTTEMASDTRESILDMSKLYMSNPNAIILCIQDGSVDAERSNVTDLVSQMDPQGKRTILVLTKVDLAEQNLTNPDRIKKILEGKLFPMKALGNFAVVTGRGNVDDSIEDIKKYEESYFSSSKLFREGVISLSQMTTQSLSFAVSECFWKMVKESIEQQADTFKAVKFNLETEWKHSYPRMRELDRDELYEKARGEILDEIVNLSMLTSKQWEESLTKKLWEKMSSHVFEHIYLPAVEGSSPGHFNTTVDIKLKEWAEKVLPDLCVDVGWETLREEFIKIVAESKKSATHDNVIDQLVSAVVIEATKKHQWEDKAANVLRVMQLNALEDRSIGDKQQWDSAITFMERCIKGKLSSVEKTIDEMVGPSFHDRWLYWKNSTSNQKVQSAVCDELEKLLSSEYLFNRKSSLTPDELTMVKKNLQTQKHEVDNELINEVWHPIYRRYFLKKSAEKIQGCKKGFYIYHQDLEFEVDFNDIVLFWRIQKMIQITANALRQQITNAEARRLERELKEVLDDYSEDEDKKKELLTHRRVILAEELKRTRNIQEKLEEFIQALKFEK